MTVLSSPQHIPDLIDTRKLGAAFGRNQKLIGERMSRRGAEDAEKKPFLGGLRASA
jgi:hypothetical protein